MMAIAANSIEAVSWWRALGAALALLLLLSPAAAAEAPAAKQTGLKGHLLIARPKMPDPRFAKTVILMIEHNAKGAIGLVINRPMGKGPAKKLLEILGIDSAGAKGEIGVHYGGPVELDHGFVLHSPEYRRQGTRAIVKGVAVSSGPNILRDIAQGKGPKKSLFILGYAGWAPGQLESELKREDWFTAPADGRFVFDKDLAGKWRRALDLLKLDL